MTIYNYKQICILTVFAAAIIRSVNVQFAMPMQMPMPYMGPVFPQPPPPPPPLMVPMPAPMPFIFPLAIASDGSDESATGGNNKMTTTTTTTTTTTSKPDMAIGLALPIPMPVPMAMPAMPAIPAMPAMPAVPAMPAYPPPTFCQGPPPRPRNCPPCPPCTCKPSCTPSFFSYCSPCHLKCRCKRIEDAPQPIPPKETIVGPPYAMGQIIGPAPVVIVPIPPMLPPIPMPPPRRRPKKKKTKYSSCSEESTESSSSDTDYLRRGKRKILNILRRNPRSSESENELVKPMLSYISENGDIKFEAKISSDDVAELLREGNRRLDNRKYQTVQVLTREDETNKPQVIVYSKNSQRGKSGRTKHKQVFLRGGISNHVLDDGKKQLIFRPADNKKISNLSVSFQIA